VVAGLDLYKDNKPTNYTLQQKIWPIQDHCMMGGERQKQNALVVQ
jgi:hypothetical protein